MMRRKFTKGEQIAELVFPSQSEWKERTISAILDGHEQRAEFDDNKSARLAAARLAATWLGRGWVEHAAKPRSPQLPAASVTLTEEEVETIARQVADEIGSNPNWMTLWDRLAQYAPGAGPRKKLMAAVQQAYRDKIDEAARMERLRKLAETREAKAAAEAAARQQELALAAAMAQQGGLPADNRGRGVVFD